MGAVAALQSVLDAALEWRTVTLVPSSNIRKARGPLTGLAFLLLGAATAAGLWLNKPNEVVGTEYAQPSTTRVDLSGTQRTSSTTPSTTRMTVTTGQPTSSAPATSSSTTTTPDSTSSTTTSSSSVPPETTPFQWRDRLPLLPPGGSAKLLGTPTQTSYTAEVIYDLAPAEISTQLQEYLKNARWSVSSASATAVTATSSEITGTFSISSTTNGSRVRIQFTRPAA